MRDWFEEMAQFCGNADLISLDYFRDWLLELLRDLASEPEGLERAIRELEELEWTGDV